MKVAQHFIAGSPSTEVLGYFHWVPPGLTISATGRSCEIFVAISYVGAHARRPDWASAFIASGANSVRPAPRPTFLKIFSDYPASVGRWCGAFLESSSKILDSVLGATPIDRRSGLYRDRTVTFLL